MSGEIGNKGRGGRKKGKNVPKKKNGKHLPHYLKIEDCYNLRLNCPFQDGNGEQHLHLLCAPLHWLLCFNLGTFGASFSPGASQMIDSESIGRK